MPPNLCVQRPRVQVMLALKSVLVWRSRLCREVPKLSGLTGAKAPFPTGNRRRNARNDVDCLNRSRYAELAVVVVVKGGEFVITLNAVYADARIKDQCWR